MRTATRHVNPRTKDVYYRVRYRREGKERALSFYGPTAADDAAEFVGLLKALGADRAVKWWNDHLETQSADSGITLDDWWPRYVASLTGLTDGTRITYQRTYERVWKRPLGAMPLAGITRADIAAVINDYSQDKADKTVRNAFGVISSCFKIAVQDGLIPASPAVKIRLPRRTEHTDTEMRFLTHQEWSVLYEHLPGHYRPLFTTLIGTRMRWGEAEALTVGDVTLGPNPTVRITKAAKWNASKSTRSVGPTKTKKSKRTITLPPEVVVELEPLLGRPSGDRLFLALKGGELRHSKVYPVWLTACESAGLGSWTTATKTTRRKWNGPRVHDLRHSHVAWLIAAGIPLPVIQARLGHENITTTIDRYGHLLPDLQVAAANAASVAMQGGPQAIG